MIYEPRGIPVAGVGCEQLLELVVGLECQQPVRLPAAQPLVIAEVQPQQLTLMLDRLLAPPKPTQNRGERRRRRHRAQAARAPPQSSTPPARAAHSRPRSRPQRKRLARKRSASISLPTRADQRQRDRTRAALIAQTRKSAARQWWPPEDQPASVAADQCGRRRRPRAGSYLEEWEESREARRAGRPTVAEVALLDSGASTGGGACSLTRATAPRLAARPVDG